MYTLAHFFTTFDFLLEPKEIIDWSIKRIYFIFHDHALVFTFTFTFTRSASKYTFQ